ncbi:hypothetical protein D3C75_852240 [compost metagenome]
MAEMEARLYGEGSSGAGYNGDGEAMMISLAIWLAIQLPLGHLIGRAQRQKRKFDEAFRHG